MSEQFLESRTDGARGSTSQERAPSVIQRIAGSQLSQVSQTRAPVPQPGRTWLAVVIVVLAVAVGAVWTYVARMQLGAALTDDQAQRLVVARKAFDSLRAQTRTSLTGYCRLLVEDPRLKSTLATAGIDAATVADILADLARLRHAGFLLILSPDGRVFAQAGASELEGLDLSASSVVKQAKDTDDAIVGSWALAGKVMDLSIKSVRYGDQLVAYLVVGQPVDGALLAAVEEQTGVSVASALANKVVFASSNEPVIAGVIARVVDDPPGAPPHVLTSTGGRYLASVVDLPETAQSHRLVLVSSLDSVGQRFRMLEWMLFVPPVLVLLAVLFALTASRSPWRTA